MLWLHHYNFPSLFPQYKKGFNRIYFDVVSAQVSNTTDHTIPVKL